MSKTITKPLQKQSAQRGAVVAPRSKSRTTGTKSSSAKTKRPASSRVITGTSTRQRVQSQEKLLISSSKFDEVFNETLKEAYNGPQIEPIGLKDITNQDLVYLAIKAKWYDGAQEVIQNVAVGKWQLWRVIGDATGILVTYIHDKRIFIYFLHGEGIHARQVRKIGEVLMALSKALNLNGIACRTDDIKLAKLYLSAPGCRVESISLVMD